jgi:hypothetical protein
MRKSIKRYFILLCTSFVFLTGCQKKILDNEKKMITSIENQQYDNNVENSEDIINNKENKENIKDTKSDDVHGSVENQSKVKPKPENFIVGYAGRDGEDILRLALDTSEEKQKIQYYTEKNNEVGNRKAHLLINDIDYADLIDIYDPLDAYYIIDTDSTDDYYELLVSTEGPKDEGKSESIWFRYIDGELVVLGHTNMYPYNGLVLKGNNTISITNENDGTEYLYEIKNDEIVLIE